MLADIRQALEEGYPGIAFQLAMTAAREAGGVAARPLEGLHREQLLAALHAAARELTNLADQLEALPPPAPRNCE
jgi:hypothetical protein